MRLALLYCSTHFVYNKVNGLLAQNGTLGIFPEGESHDHRHLIPLQVGAAVMALGAAAQGTPVEIVPVGMTYFHGAHLLRSKVAVEFGNPFKCPPRLVELYKSGDTRSACSELLEIMTKELNAVTLNNPDWKISIKIQQVRRLYQPDDENELDGSQHVAYQKKFEAAYGRFGTIRNTPEGVELVSEVEEFRADCIASDFDGKQLQLIRRVQSSYPNKFMQLGFLLNHLALFLVSFSLSLLGLLLNLPIWIICRHVAKKAQAKALAEIKQKDAAYDVVMSSMVAMAFLLSIPFYLGYTFIVANFVSILIEDGEVGGPSKTWEQHLAWAIPLAFLLLLPSFSYYSIHLFDFWYYSWKKVVAISKSNSCECKRLLLKRKKLQHKIRKFVDMTHHAETMNLTGNVSATVGVVATLTKDEV
jgi:glycerol-3-phosphate O-acyltransferase/dihydroxyacetone phosphate acyltransferase